MENKKQKIVIVLTNSFPFSQGEPYLKAELPYLVSSFDKVYFFPINPSGNLLEKLNDKISIIDNDKDSFKTALSKFKLMLIFLKELRLISRLPRKFHQIRYYWAYLQHKNKLAGNLKDKIDSLIVTHEIYLYSYWFNDLAVITALLKKAFPSIKTISRAHGFDLFEEQNKNNYIPFRYFQFKYIDKIYSVSKKGALYLKARYPKFNQKISTSYLGTVNATELLLIENSHFSIVTCSIIRNIKRLDLMIDILKNIKFNLTWHVLGNGFEEDNLKKLCKELPPHITVKFHGYLSQSQIFAFYKSNSINLFCSLSSSEGLPVSMMEAISFGIPIMSTDVGGCNEICNDETGFLIHKDFDALDVANKIGEFKNSKKNMNEFHINCRDYWMKNFCAEINYNAFLKSFNF